MSGDPSMNTAILHWATQVAAGAGPNAAQLAAPAASSLPANEASAVGSATTTTAPVVPAHRTAGDYEWLKQALANVESPERKVKRLLQHVEELVGMPVHPDFVCKPTEAEKAEEAEKKKTEVDPEDALVGDLEELSDMVEDINWAAEFGLMQGPARILKVLACALPMTSSSSSSSTPAEQAVSEDNLVRCSADVRRCLALVVAHSAQLNETLQQAYAEHHWEAVLLPLLAQEAQVSRGSGVVAAVLHACSCLCRDSAVNTLTFVQKGGIACVADLLRLEAGRASASAKVIARALFFLSYLAQTGVSAGEVLRLACAQVELRADPNEVGAEGTSSATPTMTTSTAAAITVTTTDDENSSPEAPQHSENEDVQRAAALLLLNAFQKAPEVVKRMIHEYMPRRWEEWRAGLQRGDEHDYRAELVEAVEKAG